MLTDIGCPSVPVSWGELLDKITILAIKRERIVDPIARANVVKEHDLLMRMAGDVPSADEVAPLFDRLCAVNAALWDIEDAIRVEEAEQRFGEAFVGLARSVYRRNDERAALKRAINQRLGSALTEEKSYGRAADHATGDQR